jgi:hypothetical protein
MRRRLPLLGACKQVCQRSFRYTSEVDLLVGSTRRRRSNRPPGPGAQAARAATGRSARTCLGKPTMIRGTEVVSRRPFVSSGLEGLAPGRAIVAGCRCCPSTWTSWTASPNDVWALAVQNLNETLGIAAAADCYVGVRIGTMSPRSSQQGVASDHTGGLPAACTTNRTIMQTGATACHNLIGPFQRLCYLVHGAALTRAALGKLASCTARTAATDTPTRRRL